MLRASFISYNISAYILKMMINIQLWWQICIAKNQIATSSRFFPRFEENSEKRIHTIKSCSSFSAIYVSQQNKASLYNAFLQCLKKPYESLYTLVFIRVLCWESGR